MNCFGQKDPDDVLAELEPLIEKLTRRYGPSHDAVLTCWTNLVVRLETNSLWEEASDLAAKLNESARQSVNPDAWRKLGLLLWGRNLSKWGAFHQSVEVLEEGAELA